MRVTVTLDQQDRDRIDALTRAVTIQQGAPSREFVSLVIVALALVAYGLYSFMTEGGSHGIRGRR